MVPPVSNFIKTTSKVVSITQAPCIKTLTHRKKTKAQTSKPDLLKLSVSANFIDLYRHQFNVLFSSCIAKRKGEGTNHGLVKKNPQYPVKLNIIKYNASVLQCLICIFFYFCCMFSFTVLITSLWSSIINWNKKRFAFFYLSFMTFSVRIFWNWLSYFFPKKIKQVTLTDGDMSSLANMKANLELNNLCFDVNSDTMHPRAQKASIFSLNLLCCFELCRRYDCTIVGFIWCLCKLDPIPNL